jgi:predicted ATPase with chaperone activity
VAWSIADLAGHGDPDEDMVRRAIEFKDQRAA